MTKQHEIIEGVAGNGSTMYGVTTTAEMTNPDGSRFTRTLHTEWFKEGSKEYRKAQAENWLKHAC